MNVPTNRARRTGRAAARAAAAWTFAAVVVSLAAGCAPKPLALPGRGGDPRALPGSSGEGPARTPQGGVSMKTVTGKEPPTTLIAEGGMRCTVTEHRYRETRVGDTAVCAWRSG